MHSKKPTVTIGIAAFNSESNIDNLVRSLIRQDQKGWRLQNIIIHSDCSTDKTVAEVKKIRSKYVNIIDNHNRRGFSGSFIHLLSKSKSDITVILNDDIKIRDLQFTSQLVKQFSEDINIGLVTGRPIPLPPRSFVEKAVIISLETYEQALYSTGKINNIYTCDGKILCLSKKFKKALHFPANTANMGNVDSFCYISCIKRGFSYRNNPLAQVFFRAPSTVTDWLKLTSRNIADKKILEETFSTNLDSIWKFPATKRLIINKAKNVFLKPFESAFLFVTGLYCQKFSKKYAQHHSIVWDIVTSTKKMA